MGKNWTEMCFTTKSGDFGIEWRKESDGMPVGGLFRRKADDNESAASAPNGGGGAVGGHLVDLHAAR